MILKYIKIIPKRYLFFFVGLGLIEGIGFILQYYIPLYQQELIDLSIANKALSIKSLNYLIIAICAFIFFNVFNKFLYLQYYYKLQRILSTDLLSNVLSFSKNSILSKGTGYYYDVITNDISQSLQVLSLSYFCFIYSIIRSVFVFMLMYKWSEQISIIYIIATVFSVASTIIFAKIDKKIVFQMRSLSSSLSGKIVDFLSNNLVIKYFNIFPLVKKETGSLFGKMNRVQQRDGNVNSLSDCVSDIINYISTILILIFTIQGLLNGQISYGILIALLAYFSMLQEPINHFNSIINSLFTSEISISRVLEIQANSFLEKDFVKEILPVNLINKISNVEFNNLVVKINDATILKNVTFSVNNNKTGLVGISGEGKTSLISILVKEFEPNSGNILINNQSIGAIPYLYYLQKINLFSQNLEIFNEDLHYNLTLGKTVVDDLDSIYNSTSERYKKLINIFFKEKKLKHGIEKIFSHDTQLYNCFNVLGYNKKFSNQNKELFFSELFANSHVIEILTDLTISMNFISKNKYDKILDRLDLNELAGRKFGESGISISGGEKQKICIARFLLKDNYDFFILDEPLTNVDSILKAKLLNILVEELKDKTGIIISHDFSVLSKLSDNYVVLENGIVSEEGKHEELINANGLYAKLYTTFVENNQTITT